eukprot:jgi/Chrzof1/1456/Cz10g08180.t1
MAPITDPERLAKLAKAREKALEVIRSRAKLRQAEREMERDKLQQRMKAVEEHKAGRSEAKRPVEPEASEEQQESEDEEEQPVAPAPPPKRKQSLRKTPTTDELPVASGLDPLTKEYLRNKARKYVQQAIQHLPPPAPAPVQHVPVPAMQYYHPDEFNMARAQVNQKINEQMRAAAYRAAFPDA